MRQKRLDSGFRRNDETGHHWMPAFTGMTKSAILCILLLFSPFSTAANLTVHSAKTVLESGIYRLNAQVSYILSSAARDALHNEIPLYFVVDIDVLRQREWWWDEKVYTTAQRYRLEFHTLTQQYLVDNLNNGQRRGFPQCDNALQYMGQITYFPLIEARQLLPEQHYTGTLRARLDVDQLPAPLRPIAYLSKDWQLASAWYTWPL